MWMATPNVCETSFSVSIGSMTFTDSSRISFSATSCQDRRPQKICDILQMPCHDSWPPNPSSPNESRLREPAFC